MTGGIIETGIAIFVISTIFSMFGKGGGEFYLPAMITILSIPFYVAAGVSQFIILIQSLSMVAIYSKKINFWIGYWHLFYLRLLELHRF